MGKEFSQILLATLVPIGLGTFGVFLSNKSKMVSLDELFDKVSTQVSENYQKAEKIKKEQLSKLSPSKGVNLGIIKNFMEHIRLREKVNGCKFIISMDGKSGEYSVSEIINKKDDTAKKIHDEIKVTAWGGRPSKIVDDACFDYEEVKIKRIPSKVYKGSYYWEVTGGGWWWQKL